MLDGDNAVMRDGLMAAAHRMSQGALTIGGLPGFQTSRMGEPSTLQTPPPWSPGPVTAMGVGLVTAEAWKPACHPEHEAVRTVIREGTGMDPGTLPGLASTCWHEAVGHGCGLPHPLEPHQRCVMGVGMNEPLPFG